MEYCYLEYCSEYTGVKRTATFSFMQDVRIGSNLFFSKDRDSWFDINIVVFCV